MKLKQCASDFANFHYKKYLDLSNNEDFLLKQDKD